MIAPRYRRSQHRDGMTKGGPLYLPYVTLWSHFHLELTAVGTALNMPLLSYLSVRRTLKGTSQAHAELSVVVRNNHPMTCRVLPTHAEREVRRTRHRLRCVLHISVCGAPLTDGYFVGPLLTNMAYTLSRPHATNAHAHSRCSRTAQDSSSSARDPQTCAGYATSRGTPQ
jgi:hypothetical protein